jgi:hypothetical protein
MDDPLRRRVLERLGHLETYLPDLLRRHRLAGERLSDGSSAQQFHDEERALVVRRWRR